MVTLRWLDRDGSRYTLRIPASQAVRAVENIERDGGMVL